MRRKIHFDHKLLIGAIALILCCCTLVGGTLAWFTEARLPISDGEVDAKVYWSADLKNWHDAEDGTPIFGSTQWEPGQTQIRYIRVVNAAELGFRYTLGLESEDPTDLLAQAIDVYWCDAPATAFTSFRQLQSQSGFAGTLQSVFSTPLVAKAPMSAEKDAFTVYALALHMRESAGNTFQGQTLDDISLTLDAELLTDGVTLEVPLLPGVLQALPESAIADSSSVVPETAPYAYTNTATQASLIGNKITRIGIPVKSVTSLDNAKFTLSVVKTTSTAYEYVKQYELTLPKDQLLTSGSTSTTALGSDIPVNKWIYVDVDITLHENETLAFGDPDDTVTWGWKSGYSDSTYHFRGSSDSWTKQTCGILFDICTEKMLSNDEYLELLYQERSEQALKTALAGKNISILGDSISTFKGYSNNTSYNSTIGGNAIWYDGSNGVTDVNETWWMQTINCTGMELLVNNSWSGDMVTNRGISRSLQLHNNSGTTPDLIAVYFGINDFRNEVSVTSFAATYDKMVKGMKDKYQNAEIFLFTLVYTTDSVSKPYDVEYFNDAIKTVAAEYGCTVVDLYNDSGINAETMAAYMHDGDLHPNYDGMDQITETFVDVLIKKYVPAES